ncbi:HTH-type transcriptional regulator YesS [compost metagenome]
MNTLNAILHLNVTVSIGVPTPSVHQIPRAMEDAKRGLSYRSLQLANQVLDMAELLPQGSDPVSYPFAAEKDVLQAVRLGLEEDTIEALRRFMDEYQSRTDTELLVQQAMLQLLGGIQSAILQSGYSTHELFAGANLFLELSEIREPEEMLSWFEHKVVKPYTRLLTETQGIQNKRLVERVMETISDRYMTDLSLESCADLHGTYPQKLSAAFKKVTGMNFIDYVTHFRMEQSKELLMSTHLKINEVAEKVGYQSSYFIRVFKKHEGLTPKEYRDTHGVEYK